MNYVNILEYLGYREEPAKICDNSLNENENNGYFSCHENIESTLR